MSVCVRVSGWLSELSHQVWFCLLDCSSYENHTYTVHEIVCRYTGRTTHVMTCFTNTLKNANNQCRKAHHTSSRCKSLTAFCTYMWALVLCRFSHTLLTLQCKCLLSLCVCVCVFVAVLVPDSQVDNTPCILDVDMFHLLVRFTFNLLEFTSALTFLDDLILCVITAGDPTDQCACMWTGDRVDPVWLLFCVSSGLQRAVVQLRSLFEPGRECCHWLCSSPSSSSVYCGSPGSDPTHFYHRLYTHTQPHKCVHTHSLDPFTSTCVSVDEVCMDQDSTGSEEEEFTSQLYNTLKKHLGRSVFTPDDFWVIVNLKSTLRHF